MRNEKEGVALAAIVAKETTGMRNEAIRKAEKEVHDCLNYGGVFHDGSPTTCELELAYKQGDIKDEVLHMRRFALALNTLADELEK